CPGTQGHQRDKDGDIKAEGEKLQDTVRFLNGKCRMLRDDHVVHIVVLNYHSFRTARGSRRIDNVGRIPWSGQWLRRFTAVSSDSVLFCFQVQRCSLLWQQRTKLRLSQHHEWRRIFNHVSKPLGGKVRI